MAKETKWKVSPEWYDITVEEWREYDYGGRVYRIEKPTKLYISKTTHKVVDSSGVVHCVPAPGHNGCALRWKQYEGDVSF